MLNALAIDLELCGHDVHTCLDGKAENDPNVAFRSAKDAMSDNDESSWMNRWIEVASQCDQTIVIAPEIHQQLENIVATLRRSGITVVASSETFLQATSCKLLTASLFKKSQVPHPATLSLSRYLASIEPLDGSQPASAVVLKRRDGAGCIDMKVFANPRKLTEWLQNHASQNLLRDEWIIQPWLIGRPASMALLAGDDWQLLGAVEQHIELDHSSNQFGYAEVSYLGGSGPLKGVSVEQLENLASRVREALPSGAASWIGIDFLVPDDSVGSKDLVVIEVNPRLTTSYLAYRKWYGYKLADALLGNEWHKGGRHAGVDSGNDFRFHLAWRTIE